MNLSTLKFVFFAAFNNIGIGAYMVLVAWTAAGLSEGVAEVGRVFMAASLVAIFVGPFIGNCVDNSEKKRVLLVAQIVKLVVAFLPILSLKVLGHVSEGLLYFIVALISASSSMSAVSINYLIKSSFDNEGVKNTISLTSMFREGGVVVGSILGGFIIYYLSFEISFLLLLSIAFALTIPFVLVMPRNYSENDNGRKVSIFEHARQFRNVMEDDDAAKFMAIIVVMTGLAAFMNTLLPEYISGLSFGDSKLYGNVEAFWSLGGAFAGALVVKLSNKILTSRYNPSIVIVGLLTLAIPVATNEVLLIGAHFLIGAVFSFGFISAQNFLTQKSKDGVLGKQLAISSSIGSLCGLIVYMLPTLVNYSSLSVAYYVGGSAIAILGGVILLASTLKRRLNSVEA